METTEHLSADEVELLLTDQRPDGWPRKLRHLLRGCTHCGFVLRPFREILDEARFERQEAPTEVEGYDRALETALPRAKKQAALHLKARRRAREAAEAMVGGISTLPRRYRPVTRTGPPWIEELLAKSFAERYRNPRLMVEYAEIAREVARCLDPEAHGAARVADYQSLAWAELGNAYRIREDFIRAQEAVDTALHLLESGSGDLGIRARVYELTAALHVDRRRHLSDACELLEYVVQIYQELGEVHLGGRAMSILALYTDYLGDQQRALRLIQDALVCIDTTRDPQLGTTATQLLVWLLAENGHYQEASRLLLAAGLGERLAEESLGLLKLRWVEGQIWAGLGKPSRAEKHLRKAHEGFLVAGQDYTAALVGLDLAGVWLGQGKRSEVRALAQEMVDTFRDLGVARESRRALDYFREACEQEEATPALARHVGRFLHQIEFAPDLRFAAS